MYPPHDISDAARDLMLKLCAPSGAISISSFVGVSGKTIIVVHVRPPFKYLTSRIPNVWMGFDVEFDIVAAPTMSEQSAPHSFLCMAH